MDGKAETGRTAKWLKRIGIAFLILILALVGLFIATRDWPSRISEETFVGKLVVYDLPQDRPDWTAESQTWTEDGKTVFYVRPILFNLSTVYRSERTWWISGNRYCEKTPIGRDEPEMRTRCYKVWLKDDGARIRMREDTDDWITFHYRRGVFAAPAIRPDDER